MIIPPAVGLCSDCTKNPSRTCFRPGCENYRAEEDNKEGPENDRDSIKGSVLSVDKKNKTGKARKVGWESTCGIY